MRFLQLLIFTVAFVPCVLSVCPSSSCRFTICTPNPLTFSGRPDTPSKDHVLCLNDVPVGVTNTLPGVFIPSYRPVQPPSLFKTLTLPNGTAALAYQTLLDPSTISESCVRLPIASAQIRINASYIENFVGTDLETDCVAFEIDPLLTNPAPSPDAPSEPPSTSTPPSFSPAVVRPSVAPVSTPNPFNTPSSVPTVPEETPDSPSTDAPLISDPPSFSPDVDFPQESSPEADLSRAWVLASLVDDFRVLQCNPSSLLVALNETLAIEVGDVILHIPQDTSTICEECAYLARRVLTVTLADSGTPGCREQDICFVLSTADALFEDVYDQAFLNAFQIRDRAEDSLQDVFECPTTSVSRTELSAIYSRRVSDIPTSCDGWLTLSPDGVCPFTSCPGRDIEDPSDCFSCRTDCDNGCGSEDFDVPDSIPGLFDFSEACCIHDHCYSSTFSKSQCDRAFLRDNLLSCAIGTTILFEIIPIPTLNPTGCTLSAFAYYLGVAVGGGSAHEDAQQQQSEYEGNMCQETEEEEEEDNIAATVFTDPHLRTFDGLAFDCQATGEFTMVQSSALDVEIQARFTGPDTGGSVTTGVALREGTLPAVQASIATKDSTEYVEISGCPVSFYLAGTNINPDDTSFPSGGPLITLGATVTITLPSRIGVSFRPRQSFTFGCYLESFTTFIPRSSALPANDFSGLLGKPNGISADDWSTTNGSSIPLPDDLLFKSAYEYCTQNWCVRNSNSSIFTYEPETSFSTFFGCDTPYENPPDLSSASPQLIQLCGNETACLIDGIVGDIEDARTALSSLQEADATFNRFFPMSFDPAALVVNEPTNVLITVNVNRIRDAVPSNLESFSLYRVDPVTGVQGETPVLSLEDNGDPGFSDAIRGDGVFSNLLAFLSTTASEKFGFRAVPVFDGVEDPDSPFVSTTLTGVRSFSSSNTTAVPTNGSKTISLQLERFRNNVLAVKYSWGADVRDLDTGTEFLGGIVGFSCDPINIYLTDTGDDTGAAGSETTKVDIMQAREDGLWNMQTSIQMRAGWYTPRGGSGPATLRVFLTNKESGEEVEGVGISTVINPGTQNGCASTDVAELELSVEGSLVTMTLNST